MTTTTTTRICLREHGDAAAARICLCEHEVWQQGEFICASVRYGSEESLFV